MASTPFSLMHEALAWTRHATAGVPVVPVLVGLAAVAGALNVYYARQSQAKRVEWMWDNGAKPRLRINLDDLEFPPNFVWGTATAAHQIEGNSTKNSWYEWEKSKKPDGTPRIENNDSSIVACDHWNRIPEDISLMKELGVGAYRFSIEWSKLEPEQGQWDESVAKHYHDEIDQLLAAGITPYITLHHFTNPTWFQRLGAFEKAENIQLFVNHCKRAFQEYGSKVHHWMTINEAEVITAGGYFTGDMPPGKQDWQLAAEHLKNLCEAHVQTYHELKAMPHGQEAQIGMVKNVFWFEPKSDWNPLERYVANFLHDVFNMAIINFFKTGHFNARIFTARVHHYNPKATKANDFIGLNFYSHYQVRVQLDANDPFVFVHAPGALMTDMDYPLYPEGIYRALKLVSTIGVPVIVTENGIADAADDRRALFIRRYLYAVSRAIREGVDCRGYFYWSLMDNFEWGSGYGMRFGLYEVDFATQKRTLRAGALPFKKIVQRFSTQKPTLAQD